MFPGVWFEPVISLGLQAAFDDPSFSTPDLCSEGPGPLV